MIVVTQLLSRIGSLLKTGTPEASDPILKIPNQYLGPLPFPVSVPSNLSTVFTDSFAVVAQATITNTGGGLVTSICDVVPGVWEFSAIIDSEFNWLNANPIAQDNRLVLTKQLVTNLELWSMAARVTRTVVVVPPFRMTLTDQMTFRLIQNGNGVGQTSTCQVNLIGNRLL
jgi:hypothetical protein